MRARWLRSVPARTGRSAASRCPARSRCTRRAASPSTTLPTSPSPSARARRCASSPRCSAKRRRSARSIRVPTTRPSAVSSRSGSRAIAASGTGPLRDRVLEVRFVTADGRLVKGGGPTVKNVSGFDIPRLLVGSFGTHRRARAGDPALPTGARRRRVERDRRRSVRRPPRAPTDRRASRGTGERTHVLIEGVAADVAAERQAAGAEPVGRPRPRCPKDPTVAASRSRPPTSAALAPSRPTPACAWLAEVGVGTVHVAADNEAALAAARAAAAAHGGWLLREAGAPGLDGFGVPLPNRRSCSGSAPRSIPRASSTRPVRVRPRLPSRLTVRSTVRPPCMTLPSTSSIAAPRHVLAVDEEELVACVACGLCLPHCPTYRVTGLEAASPRGRIAAMRAVELDGAPIDDAFRRTMETCVQCRGCEIACPSGVPFGHLMEGHARVARGRGHRAVAPLRRVAEWLGYVRGAAASLAAARAHVAALARAAPAPGAAAVRVAEALAAVAAHPLDRRGPARRVPVHRMRHGRLATRRPPRRAAP